MRLLPVGNDHGGGGAAEGEAAAHRRGHQCRDHQHLPLRHLPAGARGDPHGRESLGDAMKINRRSFIVSSAAVTGGLALGFRLPFGGPDVARAQDGSPEIGVWVAIAPNDTVYIRVVRSEMGQGTITGLAQLVAEELRDRKEWKIVGKPIKRLDTADKVNGKMVYGIDLKMPGMLNAAIKACPVFGGTVKSFDAAAVGGMAGVKKVVQVGDNAVAVVAGTWWQAKTALDKLPIVWDEGPNAKVSQESIHEMLKAGRDAEQALVGHKAGDAHAALSGAAKKVEAVYAYPFQNHVCMEPMNITARYTADKCEAWGPTQNGEGAFAQVLAASGLPADKGDASKNMP